MLKTLKNTTYLLLFGIVVFAAAIRFYQISSLPVSLYWDEVSTGYNAYSIATTGKDEFGISMPLLFKAFNDYKMPVNIYLSALPIKLFGLNELSVRFTSAFFGTLTVLITFFLVKEIFTKENTKKRFGADQKLPLLAAFFLAISPWHIQFSRAAFEANVGLFFVVFGTYLFFKSFQKSILLPMCGLSYIVAMYSYRSILGFVFLLVLGLSIIWWRKIFDNKKYFIASALIGLVLCMPLVIALVGKGASRFYQTSIQVEASKRSLDLYTKGTPANKNFVLAKVFTEGYFSAFSPDFLFIKGDPNGRHNVRGMGLLYLWEIPFILFGLFVVFRRMPRKIGLTLLVWIIAFPLPAAFSIPTPHALRTLNILPLPQIITAIGLLSLLTYFRKFSKIYIFALSVIIVLTFLNFITLYTTSHSRIYAQDWGDGYKQLTMYVNKNYNSYDAFIISGHYWQPYAYMLFYSQFDPKKYQNGGNSTHFDKYYFGGTSWDLDADHKELGDVNLRAIAKGNALVALSPEEYRDQEQNLIGKDTIYDHNGKLVFIISHLK